VCEKPGLVEGGKGRRLQTVSMVSDVTIKTKDKMFIPILPKPAISINLDAGSDDGKGGSGSASVQKTALFPFKDMIPTIILPEPAVTINMPDKPMGNKGGNINIEGSLHGLLPGANIIPILPQPKLSIEMPEKIKVPLKPNINFEKETVSVSEGDSLMIWGSSSTKCIPVLPAVHTCDNRIVSQKE
jgi:hypothetical protein